MLDKSLENLGTDHVDLYIYHMWDHLTPLYDIMEGLSQVVKAGKARYIGISNCFAWQLCKANALAEREGFPSFVSVQGHYNLIFREEEREMAPFCAEDNIAMTPYSALAEKRGVSMAEISLAWLLTRVTAPVVGATRLSHVEGAARVSELTLTAEECRYLEELYTPHPLVGVMAQNTRASAGERHVWTTGDQ